jgi:hypothetical protein
MGRTAASGEPFSAGRHRKEESCLRHIGPILRVRAATARPLHPTRGESGSADGEGAGDEALAAQDKAMRSRPSSPDTSCGGVLGAASAARLRPMGLLHSAWRLHLLKRIETTRATLRLYIVAGVAWGRREGLARGDSQGRDRPVAGRRRPRDPLQNVESGNPMRPDRAGLGERPVYSGRGSRCGEKNASSGRAGGPSTRSIGHRARGRPISPTSTLDTAFAYPRAFRGPGEVPRRHGQH